MESIGWDGMRCSEMEWSRDGIECMEQNGIEWKRMRWNR